MTTATLSTSFESEALPHQSAVFHFALKLCRNHAQAEDLTQETYLRAMRGFGSFRFGTSIRSWLFRICKNAFIDRFRRRQRVGFQSFEEGQAEQVASPTATSMAAIDGYDEGVGDEVLHELAQLPDVFREALLLCDVEGFSYEEIAEQMQTPIGTVRSRISRARAQLAEKLEPYARELGLVPRH